MIFLFCALYPEAAALISHYGLKKDTAESRFPIFCGGEGEICLTVTGPGEVAAAAAVGCICTKYRAGRADLLLNIGSCAAVAMPAVAEYHMEVSGDQKRAGLPGRAFLCNRLTEAATGKTFYPDMIYRHGFRERGIVTGMNIMDDAKAGFSTGLRGVPDGIFAACESDGFFLYDMEAAAVYQAGAYFFGPHQMSFLKIVSDVQALRADPVPTGGMPECAVSEETVWADGMSECAVSGKSVPTNPDAGRSLIKEEIMRIMEDSVEEITAYIDLLRSVVRGRDGGEEATADERFDAAFAEKLCRDLWCSQTMRSVLYQHLRYCVLAGIDYRAVAAEMYRDGRLPCRDKREGKLRFEELRRELL